MALLLVLTCHPANAVRTPIASQFGQTCPGGATFCARVPLSPKRVFDFTTGSLPNGFSFSRATTANYFDSSGVLQSAAINTPRYDYGIPGSTTLYGLLIEATATNKLLWSRDLTNPAWTQVTATTAEDQTGIDNVSNSASSFLALGANSTVCQTVTQASTPSTFSVFLKRLGGTGNVAISQDGGATYATTTLTGSWQRFSHAIQSTLNPGICIRIATGGDQIAVDIAQFETNTVPGGSVRGYFSSPIITTSSTVTRSGDSLSMPASSPTGTTDSVGAWFNKNSGTFIYEFQAQPANTTITYVSVSGANGVSIFNNNTNLQFGSNNCGSSNSLVTATPNKAGAVYGSRFFAISVNSTHCSSTTTNPTTFGALSFGGGVATEWVRKFTYWNYALTTAQLNALTL